MRSVTDAGVGLYGTMSFRERTALLLHHTKARSRLAVDRLPRQRLFEKDSLREAHATAGNRMGRLWRLQLGTCDLSHAVLVHHERPAGGLTRVRTEEVENR